MNYPLELPEKPVGWKQSMVMHLNYGSAGGYGSYRLFDAEGNDTGIIRQYDTRKGAADLNGLHVPEAKTDIYRSWAKLRAAWPEILSKLPSTSKSGSVPAQSV